MFYIVKSNTPALRDKIIDKILSSKEQSREELIVFDFEETKSIEEALFQYLSFSIDGQEKIILIKNANFINAKTIEKHVSEHFERAINTETDNTIILSVDKLNKTGKLNKKFSDKFNILEKDAPKDEELISFIMTFFKNNNIEIEDIVIKNIYSKLGDNFDLIVTELNKLELLADGKITNEQVNKALLDFSRERLYTIATVVYMKDVEGISRMIKQLISEGESPFMIGDALNRVGSAFLRYYILRDKGYTDNEISNITGWSPWFIRNYADYFYNWKSVEEISEFYYETIINDSFFDFIDYQPKNALRQLEKLLISAVTK